MRVVLFYRTRGSIYPYWYVQEFTDSYDVDMVRCKKYNVKHESIEETATLKKDVKEMFLVATDDVERSLCRKYLWQD